jgi:hypothetical protein
VDPVQKAADQKKADDMKRKSLIEQYNGEIQAQVRRLNIESGFLTAAQKAEIEKKITSAKTHLNNLLEEQRGGKGTQSAPPKLQSKPSGSGPVELTLSDIGKNLQDSALLLKILRVRHSWMIQYLI